jgi:hypothetical protein
LGNLPPLHKLHRILPSRRRKRSQEIMNCEICSLETANPVHAVFTQKKVVRWIICENCCLILIKTIKRMAATADLAGTKQK